MLCVNAQSKQQLVLLEVKVSLLFKLQSVIVSPVQNHVLKAVSTKLGRVMKFQGDKTMSGVFLDVKEGLNNKVETD